MSSGLFYYGTSEDVRLGDKIEIRGWFGRSKLAEVVYLPGVSPPHPDLDYDGGRQWAVRDELNNIYPIHYEPERLQPPKKFRLLSRGSMTEGINGKTLE